MTFKNLRRKIYRLFCPTYRRIEKLERMIESVCLAQGCTSFAADLMRMKDELGCEVRNDVSQMANVFFAPEDCKTPRGLVTKIQMLDEYLMKNLQRICDEVGVKFWLRGGTLLGAVRHGGFIPWDDDVDLGIMRSDLEKLQKHLAIRKDCEFEIRHFHFTQSIHSIMARFVFKDLGIPVFLDLFTYDNCDWFQKDNAWERYLQERQNIKRKIIATGIHNNFRNGIDDPSDEKILMGIFNEAIKKFDGPAQDSAILFGIEHFTPNNTRIHNRDTIFPLVKMKFGNGEYYAPAKWKIHLTEQYGCWESLPGDIGVAKHVYNYTHHHIEKMDALIESLGLRKQRIGYAAGAWDMFHVGHLNLLKRARESCDKLIVGVTSDELLARTKNKLPIIPVEDRAAIVHACKYVDDVIIQHDLDKVNAWNKLRYDVLFVGDDWKGHTDWLEYERQLSLRGASIIYFPYTETISSTKLARIVNRKAG